MGHKHAGSASQFSLRICAPYLEVIFMDVMKFKINLTVNDWLAYQQLLSSEAPRKYLKTWFLFIVNAVVWFLLAVIVMSTLREISTVHWPTAITISVVFLLLIFNHYINVPKLSKHAYAPKEDGAFCGSHIFELSEEEMKISSEASYSVYKWGVFKRIKQENGILALFIDTSSAVLIPLRDLENKDEIIHFLSEKVK